MNKIKVLLVDDHAILRMGLVSLLGTESDFTVVGDAGGGAAALEKYAKLKPNVVILDLMMPEMDGIATTRALRAADPEAKILILTTFGTSDGIAAALAAGATGAIMKNAPFEELVAAVRSVAAGERSVSQEIERILAEDPPAAELSSRQREILALMVRGLTNADIAKTLEISVDMVKEHGAAIYGKMGAANRTEAVAIALRKKILDL